MMLTIGFLDLQKQGDSTIILLPEGNNAIIIDLPEAETALGYLKENTIEHIEVIFLTHFDDDHVKDIIKFCNLTKKENYHIKEVRYNYSNALSKGKELTKKSRDLLRALAHLERCGVIKVDNALAFNKLEFLDVKIMIIYPEWKDLEQSFVSQAGRNEGCIVLKLEYNKKKLLFGADLISKGWKKINKRGIDISANLFRYPHHGDFFEKSTDQKVSTKELLDLVNPNITIISANADDSPKHPNPKTIEELERLCSLKDNFIFLCTRGISGQRRIMDGQKYKKYTDRKNLCAGHIQVKIKDEIEIETYYQ